jgi:hypothetical protein
MPGRRTGAHVLLLFIAGVGRDGELYIAGCQIYVRSYLPIGSCAGF